MIPEAIAKAFNDLMHKMYVESYIFKGIAAAFRKAGYPGFAEFAKHEGRERWMYGGKVRTCLEKFGMPVALAAIPAAKTDYANPAEALTAMSNQDFAILKSIKAGTKASADAGEHYSASLMNDFYGKMLHEYNEVAGVLKKVQGGKDLSSLDAWLYEHYSEEKD